MTSREKIHANRANAAASTGPKSAAGKSRAARNALRHGLNVPVRLDPALGEVVDSIACRIVDEDADPELLGLARAIAEAQADLLRVRSYRKRRIEPALADPRFQSKKTQDMRLWAAIAILLPLDGSDPTVLPAALDAAPLEGAEKLATV